MKVFVEQFRELHPKFSRLYAKILACADLTLPQYVVLMELSPDGKELITMTDISKKLCITKPAVTNLVDRLEENGLLKRMDDPKDRRVCLLQITNKGRSVVEKVQEKLLVLVVKTAGHFSVAEQKTIKKFYSVWSEVMDEALIPFRGEEK